MQSNYMYGSWGDHHSDTFVEPEVVPSVQEYRKQHKMDSFMESVCNIAVGFFISWAVWVFVVAPLFNLPNDGGTSFLITCVFTVTSLIRQYVLRRLFDGETIWETIRAKTA